MRRSEESGSAVTVFAVFNFVFAALCLLWLGVLALALAYGIFLSGDTGDELLSGVVGVVLFAVPGVLGLVIYPVAGLGLMYRKAWGYYFHLIGAVLAVLSCIGVVYTVFAFTFAFRPEFADSFGAAGESA
jgi:hypothetical protein